MHTLELALRSRTVWTIIALFIIGGFHNITGYIPESLMPYLNSILGLLAIFFKINTKKDYR